MSDNQQETIRVRITGGHHYQDGTSHPPGTELTVRKDVYETFSNKFEPVMTSETTTTTTERGESGESSEFNAAAFVNRVPQDDVIDDIESGEYDAQLDVIEAAEKEGRNRNGVLDAIDAQRS